MMNPENYLILAALLFSIGAVGVLVRRNALIAFMCVELMLNASNLSLLAFNRMWGGGDGQIFAIIVLVVAACEVAIGLGLIVAMHRRGMTIDTDQASSLRG